LTKPLRNELSYEWDSQSFPVRYEAKTVEKRCQEFWEKLNLYKFDWSDESKPTYSIDTPPPYPSGEFHMGNALNWCYFDFVARYKRMRGFNVHFPQGWDCHGLPTEVRAETAFKVKKSELPLEEFKKLCVKLTEEYIDKMKRSMKAIGYSIDWSLEYRTMDPDYYKLTQLSFIRLFKEGMLYRGEHPVNWCPRCETAIAEAEVEYVNKEGLLYYIRFKVDGEKVSIATTRPELLPAIVAVAAHPNDERYGWLKGRRVEVPLISRTVPVIFDEEVDPNFGTGVVMVCTFGDKTDVKWRSKHELPIITVISENGVMNEHAGPYKGLTIEECRKAITSDLNAGGFIEKMEKISQSIGTCWRCHTPIEILSRKQWFMRTRDLTDAVIEWTHKVKWIPEFAKSRMIDWAKSLDWDWVISRQRVFATPIPVWYCKRCGHVLAAEESWLPVDPRFEGPRENVCPKCGGSEFQGEVDVMDTWMDSSITCAVHAGWPSNMKLFDKLFPADLQPNGLDIIRTWDYYLMVKHLALFKKAPYKVVLINGMVRGVDGRMMHKSYGNYVEATEVLEKYSADALRQWAAGGAATGYDVPFKWGDLEYGKKFLTKLWNAARFIKINLTDEEYTSPGMETLDKWITTKLEELIPRITDYYENFQFNMVLESLRDFTWHKFCDQYIEAVKYRLYEDVDSTSRRAAQLTLLRVLLTIIKLLAPICPHITETIYQMFRREDDPLSVHQLSWPVQSTSLIDEEAEAQGDAIIETISAIRRKKSEMRIPLKNEVSAVIVRAPRNLIEALCKNRDVIVKTCKIQRLITEEAEKADMISVNISI